LGSRSRNLRYLIQSIAVDVGLYLLRRRLGSKRRKGLPGEAGEIQKDTELQPMKFASMIAASLLALLFLGGFASSSFGQESRWGSPEEKTVKFIIAAETKWANSACSPQPDLNDVIADDFQGTSPSGRRYGKKDAITTDTKSLERDCQLGQVKVRFFGDSIAIAYGEESAIKAKDGKETKHCLIWTDTWLKRAGKWQIVAAQDTDIPCKP
jgi:Domain of unknown function (DUF4440)